MGFEAARGEGITREGLSDGSLLRAARGQAAAEFPVLSDQEIAASLRATLAQRPEKADVWVFGYGSLVWNPAIEYADKRIAYVRGWHRRFCLSSGGRGSPERPGLMLALAKGGSCQGVAYRLDESNVEKELPILWVREMLMGSYHARWMTARTKEGKIPILAFVANPDHPRFTGDLSEAEMVERIATARGPLGTCLDYLRHTIASLQALGINDPGLMRLHSKVEAKLASAAGR